MATQQDPPHARASRKHAALHLLHPDQLQESLVLSAQPSLRNSALAGLQTALGTLIALPLFYLSPWAHLVGYASLGTLAALFGRMSSPARRRRIVAISGLWLSLAVLIMSSATYLGANAIVMLLLLALACSIFFFGSVTLQIGVPGALIFVFAAGASLTAASSWREVLERTTATAITAALAWLICTLTDFLRHRHAPSGQPFPVDPVRPLSHRLIASARIFLGTAISSLLIHALGEPHPAWAAMGTLAVMQGAHLHISMNRSLQRMAGTVVGACFAWAILKHDPSIGMAIGLLVALQVLTEVIIGYNYAIGQMAVTPMALIMSYMASSGMSGEEMAPERVINTIIGAAIGIVLAVLCSSMDARAYLAQHHQTRRAK
jgi:uncharacterized membrane protein YgaE (UPF0421/DUF939 family)